MNFRISLFWNFGPI